MHPELLSSLAAEHRRDLAAAVAASRASRPRSAGPASAARRLLALPRLRVSWTHLTLAAVAGGRRGDSLVIVISASRAR